MTILGRISTMLLDPRTKGVDLESDQLLSVHREILMDKAMMKQVFLEFYQLCLEIDRAHFSGEGQRVEIGAGVTFIKDVYPDILVSDIKKAPHLDLVIDAQEMQLEAKSTGAIFGLNCFHHFPDPSRFFSELDRVLVPGGGCVLIEPHYGMVASRFYQGLHASEHFNKSQPNWASDREPTIMQGANQALSYIVFIRDRTRFLELHPTLEIVYQKPVPNYLRYLCSGGLNFRQLLPSFTTPLLRLTEFLLQPLNQVFALHHAIGIRKRSESS